MAIYSLSELTINNSCIWNGNVNTRYVSKKPFLSLMKLLVREKCDKVIFITPYHLYRVLILVFLYRTFLSDSIKVILQEYNYDCLKLKRSSGLRRLCKSVLLNFVVDNVDYIIFHSSQVRDCFQQLYKKMQSKLKFVPLPKNHTVITSHFVEPEEEDSYILVAGEDRDFEIIFKIARQLEDRQIPIKIITRSYNRDEINILRRKHGCKDISVSFDVPKSQYVLILQKAKVVVIPSFPSGCSNGQLVLLDSYALGKAVICLEGPHIWDYYGKDSVLTYRENDDQGLLRQIDLLYTNPRLLRSLKQKSFEYLDHLRSKEDFVKEIFVETQLQWIDQCGA